MVEIGRQLARAREEKGLSLEQIAEQTRISLKYLQGLEQGEFDFLPRPYVIAYLKTVARLVGLDGEALIHDWRAREAAAAAEEVETAEGAVEAELPKRAESPQPRPARAVESASFSTGRETAAPPPGIPYLKEVAIGFALLAGMALLLYFSTRSPKPETAPLEPATEIPFEQVAKEAATQQEQEPAPIEEIAPVRRPMRLEVRAEEEVWVQVVTDKRDSTDYTMRRGNVQAWQALEQFYVRLGNAGVVKILLDGKDLGVIGSRGQVGSVIITHEGIKSKRLRGGVRRPAADTSSSPAQQDTSRN